MTNLQQLLNEWRAEMDKLVQMDKARVTDTEFFRQSNRVSLAHIRLLQAQKKHNQKEKSL